MAEVARLRYSKRQKKGIHLETMESYDYPKEAFDLVTFSLKIHYV